MHEKGADSGEERESGESKPVKSVVLRLVDRYNRKIYGKPEPSGLSGRQINDKGVLKHGAIFDCH